MADITISQLPPYTDFDGNDLIPVVDVTTATTRKYTIKQVLGGSSKVVTPLTSGTSTADGDVQVDASGGKIYMKLGGVWKQIFPAIYS
jgi:hypothetical protein